MVNNKNEHAANLMFPAEAALPSTSRWGVVLDRIEEI